MYSNGFYYPSFCLSLRAFSLSLHYFRVFSLPSLRFTMLLCFSSPRSSTSIAKPATALCPFSKEVYPFRGNSKAPGLATSPGYKPRLINGASPLPLFLRHLLEELCETPFSRSRSVLRSPSPHRKRSPSTQEQVRELRSFYPSSKHRISLRTISFRIPRNNRNDHRNDSRNNRLGRHW